MAVKFDLILGLLRQKDVAGITEGPDGEIILDTGVSLGTAITANISSDVDDFSVTDIEKAVVLRLNVTGNRSITGLIPFNTASAWMVFCANVGTGNLSIKNNDAGSTAENRFLIGGNKTIQTDEGILLFYDPVSLRWRGSGILI